MTEPVGSSRGMRPTHRDRAADVAVRRVGGVALVVMTASGAVYLIGSIVG
jgi:hypothetical protein